MAKFGELEKIQEQSKNPTEVNIVFVRIRRPDRIVNFEIHSPFTCLRHIIIFCDRHIMFFWYYKLANSLDKSWTEI
jgi:hypothetical protein